MTPVPPLRRQGQGQAWPADGVIRVRTRETISQPEIAGLLMRGARACGFPQPGGVIAELVAEIEAEHRAIFVGFAAAEPRVVAIGEVPRSWLTIAGAVHLAYSERAPRPLVVKTGRVLREWMEGKGQKYTLALNLLHPDEAYMRGLRHFGRPSRVGGVIRFDFEES